MWVYSCRTIRGEEKEMNKFIEPAVDGTGWHRPSILSAVKCPREVMGEMCTVISTSQLAPKSFVSTSPGVFDLKEEGIHHFFSRMFGLTLCVPVPEGTTLPAFREQFLESAKDVQWSLSGVPLVDDLLAMTLFQEVLGTAQHAAEFPAADAEAHHVYSHVGELTKYSLPDNDGSTLMLPLFPFALPVLGVRKDLFCERSISVSAKGEVGKALAGVVIRPTAVFTLTKDEGASRHVVHQPSFHVHKLPGGVLHPLNMLSTVAFLLTGVCPDTAVEVVLTRSEDHADELKRIKAQVWPAPADPTAVVCTFSDDALVPEALFDWCIIQRRALDFRTQPGHQWLDVSKPGVGGAAGVCVYALTCNVLGEDRPHMGLKFS